MSPILGENGQPMGVTVFARDITDRKDAENKLGEMHRPLLVKSNKQDKRLLILIDPVPGEDRPRVEVADNGIGLLPESLPRLSTQESTPHKTGHGFGLHISALAATEMTGSLTCASAGRDQGATFTLELPVNGAGDRS